METILSENNGISYDIEVDLNELETNKYIIVWNIISNNPKTINEYNNSFKDAQKKKNIQQLDIEYKSIPKNQNYSLW